MRHLLTSAFFPVFAVLASAAPEATVVSKTDVIECVIDTSSPDDTGAVIWLFGGDLPGKSNLEIAGIRDLDYKMEGGRLARFTDDGKNPWQDLGEVRSLKKGDWQISILPKSLFFNQKAVLRWRLLLFPKGGEAAVPYPADSTAELRLDCFVAAPAATAESLDFAYFFFPPPQAASGVLVFFDFKRHARLKTVGAAPAAEAFEPWDRRSFNEPCPGCLWWPRNSLSAQDGYKEDMKLSCAATSYSAVVFDIIRDVEAWEMDMLLDARLLAAAQAGKRAFFYVESPEDAPLDAKGLILRPGKDAEKHVLLLGKIAEKCKKADFFVSFGHDFFRLPEKERGLLSEAWLRFAVEPLLEADFTVEEMDEPDLTAFLWLREHLRCVKKTGSSINAMPPLPLEAGTGFLGKDRGLSFDHYLRTGCARVHEEFMRSPAAASLRPEE